MKLLRLVLSLLMSLCIGTAICLSLIKTGVIKLEKKPEILVAKILRMKVETLDPVQGGRIDTHRGYKMVAIDKDSEKIDGRDDTSPNKPEPDKGQKPEIRPALLGTEFEEIQRRAISFLSSPENMGTPDLQYQFERFLTAEMNLDPDVVLQLLRMSFWKHFVTLQQKWMKGDWQQLQASFKTEKTLKRAGFKAMGIGLVESIVSDAEQAVAGMKDKLDIQTMEGGPV